MAGHPGNLNAAKWPWRTYWRRRALKRKDRWVFSFVEPYKEELFSDKPEATAGEKRMIEVASAARACWMLVGAERYEDSRHLHDSRDTHTKSAWLRAQSP
jgi:hypothetical protein